MSIINDALKKAQFNLKKPKRSLKSNNDQKPKSGQDITNVYEKMYKAREEQKAAAASQNIEKKTSSVVNSPRQAKKWIKTLFAVVFFFVSIFLSFYLLKSYLPFENFMSSSNGKTRSSRFHISRPTTKKRTYKPGELFLNGISSIDGKNVALINDEIYEIGEMVEGKKITSIGLDKVELRDAQRIFTIKVR